jgi:hypothetical protein
MGVYYALRSPYCGASGRYYRRFDDDNLLAFFQRLWGEVKESDDNETILKEILGQVPYGFALYDEDDELLPAPKNMRQLYSNLRESVYHNDFLTKPGCIQILTDDDELEMAYFFFDDAYLSRHSEKTAFLLHSHWKLPDVPTNSSSNSEPTTYAVCISYDCSASLDPPGSIHLLRGVRLSDLTPKKINKILSEYFGESDHSRLWQEGEAFDTWLQRMVALPIKAVTLTNARLVREQTKSDSCFSVSDHAISLAFHHAIWEFPPTDHNPRHRAYHLYHHWYFFDDIWLSAYPALGKALLRYAKHWNPLR